MKSSPEMIPASRIREQEKNRNMPISSSEGMVKNLQKWPPLKKRSLKILLLKTGDDARERSFTASISGSNRPVRFGSENVRY